MSAFGSSVYRNAHISTFSPFRIISRPACIRAANVPSDLSDANEEVAVLFEVMKHLATTTNETVHAAIGAFCVVSEIKFSRLRP